MIVFLHTSKDLVDRFENLVRKFDAKIKTKHIVNEGLLETALNTGEVDEFTFKNEVDKIKKDNPELIICTCSTYGALSETYEIERIDEPIARYIVENYFRIGLVYTANSTKATSSNLLNRLAKEQDRNIEIINCDCSSSWIYFKEKDFIKYELSIAEKIKTLASKVDVVFLAQASMEGAKKYLTAIKIKVFSSPEFGIKDFIKR